MIPRRVMTLLVGVGLAALCFTSPAWAHPGHGPTDGSLAFDAVPALDRSGAAKQGDAGSWDALRHHSPPPAAALVVAVLALLATIPHRRRALACALVLLLSMVSLEGVLHAALHLHHARHSDGLAIGASPAQQAAAGPDPGHPSATPVIVLGEIVERYVAPAPDVVIASSRGRAPPLSPRLAS